MNERDYGVGIANRYALFMGEETGDPLTDLMRASKGKENKQQKKVTTAASPVAPTPGSKSASSKNTAAAAGASAAPPATGRTSSGKQGTSGPVPAVGPAAKTQRDGKHQPTAGVTGTQKQPQPQRQQAVAATDQSARVTGREDRVRAERGSGTRNHHACERATGLHVRQWPVHEPEFRDMGLSTCARSPCALFFLHPVTRLPLSSLTFSSFVPQPLTRSPARLCASPELRVSRGTDLTEHLVPRRRKIWTNERTGGTGRLRIVVLFSLTTCSRTISKSVHLFCSCLTCDCLQGFG